MTSPDPTAELAARLAQLEERLAALEERAPDDDALGSLLAGLLPAEALRHMRAARRSDLLAIRVLLDRWLARLEREPARRRRRETIHLD
jgi:hypothetical protein